MIDETETFIKGNNIITFMRSEEDKVLEAFFSIPKYWHFAQLQKETKLSKPSLSRWLGKFIKLGLIKKMKPRGKAPYYIGMEENPEFLSKKRLHAMKLLTDSGLVSHLSTLKGAKVVILFGSFSRADWYKESDIDIFIFGKDDDFDQYKYQDKLHRHIEVHLAKNESDLKRIDKMIPYIIAGDFIKGSIEDLGVKIEAAI